MFGRIIVLLAHLTRIDGHFSIELLTSPLEQWQGEVLSQLRQVSLHFTVFSLAIILGGLFFRSESDIPNSSEYCDQIVTRVIW